MRLAGVLMLAALPLAAQWDDGPGDVPYVPTPQHVVDQMLKLAGVKEGDIVYDLGCGDGRIVVTAAKTFKARGTGIDINPERIKEANENAKQAGVTDRVRFLEQNLFDSNVSDATVVTLYLLPDVNLRLRPRLLAQLKPGSRIVSHSFDMGDWKPDKTVEIEYRKLHLWNVTEEAKARYGGIDGEWAYRMTTPNGEMDGVLTLQADGEKLKGNLAFGPDRRFELQDGTVNGKTLKFTIRRERPGGGAMVYNMSGTVNGSEIKGTTEAEMEGQKVTQEWSAKRK